VAANEAVGSHETFEAVHRSYLEQAGARRAPSSLATEGIRLRHFAGFLGERAAMPASEITPTDIERYLTHRRREVTGTTANKELQTLRQLFDYAVRQGTIGHNPTYNVPRFKRSGRPHRFMVKAEIEEQLRRGGFSSSEARTLRRLRYLNSEEIAKLLELARERSPWLYPILATMAFTGMRRGEAVALEWGDVDLKAGKLWVRSRKQSQTREFAGRDIDLHEKLRGVPAQHRMQSREGRHVFTTRDGSPVAPDDLHRAFKGLVGGTEFDGIGLHCLRHSFASNLAAQGVDARLIDHYMGHQTEEMRSRYQHLFPEKKSEGIQKLRY